MQRKTKFRVLVGEADPASAEGYFQLRDPFADQAVKGQTPSILIPSVCTRIPVMV